jgi:polar amino acid transport system substrate-binding protein
MTDYAATTGRRILEPAFMEIRQAVGLPRALAPEAVASVASLIEDLVVSGVVRDELARSGVEATVAPVVRERHDP